MFGGVTRHGADLAFCRDLYTLDTGTMTWSEVKLGYSLPNARYGHTMGVVTTPPGAGSPGLRARGGMVVVGVVAVAVVVAAPPVGVCDLGAAGRVLQGHQHPLVVR